MVQWNFLYSVITYILAVMCPYKRVHSRISRNKWINRDIFHIIREMKSVIKRFKVARDPNILTTMIFLRNRLNSAVDKAKAHYVKTLLVSSKANPKKFWRKIKSLNESDVDIVDTVTFKDPSAGDIILNDNKCNFINNYFAEIETRICNDGDERLYISGPKCDSEFHFMPPELCDIMFFSEAIDVCTSSGIPVINMNICKTTIQHIPEKF